MAPVPPSSSEYEAGCRGSPSHHHQAHPFPGLFQHCPPTRAVGSFPPPWCGIPTRTIERALPSNLSSLVHSGFHFFFFSLFGYPKRQERCLCPFVPGWPGSIFPALTAGLALITVPLPWPWESRVASSHTTAEVGQGAQISAVFFMLSTPAFYMGTLDHDSNFSQ